MRTKIKVYRGSVVMACVEVELTKTTEGVEGVVESVVAGGRVRSEMT